MENNVEVNSKKFKVGIVEIAIILEGILLGLIFITHSLWLFIPLIIVGIYSYTHKAKTKKKMSAGNPYQIRLSRSASLFLYF